ncbi:DUF4412 domain-containing protein [Dankookia rubra]|uniref:DUF4412 domain-containing protein n=1 Tax=Dankookia rubra TaxID=1442381 RepID=A0A4V3A967_9PROT|nr:DUF4412 domain-containing protein [Dankookia rubra]TDH58095.1 DUF4412 domain-containing protein [Dankookia rubra]
MRRILPALLLAALPAAAQERPVMVPTRDVAVTYRVTAGQGQGHELRMAWLVAERKLRVDAEGAPGWSVIDQAAKRMLVVMDQQRAVLEVPANTGPGGLSLPTEPPASARFAKDGSATVAGLRCTVWRYEDGDKRGETCLTADGVMLRSSGGQRDGQGGSRTGAVEATKVAYGPQDPARFQAPPGYRSMQLPPGLTLPGVSPPR